MSSREHRYAVTVTWTGNDGVGTAGYTSYRRAHDINAAGNPLIRGSSDPAFQGDPACWNPEQLLVASLSACHQLWYLHLCANAGISVLAYSDNAEGWMQEVAGGAGQFVRVRLHPRAILAPGADLAVARALHGEAQQLCFIARSVNFPVEHDPGFEIAG